MPELPEVETTRCGIEPHVCDQIITAVDVRQHQLRWPIPAELESMLKGQRIAGIERRGKYLLFVIGENRLLIHLGMSGSLRMVSVAALPGKHDHVDIHLSGDQLLRYTDPRRFGAIVWVEGDPAQHELLAHLGPEPLSDDFDGAYLHRRARGRKVAVKNFIMDSRIVVGVGNIYANEALYRGGIHPNRATGSISAGRYRKLAACIKQVLQEAIGQGGTTLRDFVGGDGKPGYFKQSLQVYGRGGETCYGCGKALSEIRIGQRSSVFCSVCQT